MNVATSGHAVPSFFPPSFLVKKHNNIFGNYSRKTVNSDLLVTIPIRRGSKQKCENSETWLRGDGVRG